jgi:hypothetical protein
MCKTIDTDAIMFSGMTDCLSIAVENAVLQWGDTVEEFFDKFLSSGLADSFSKQEPFVTTGCTGEELVAMVNEEVSGARQEPKESDMATNYTHYYWIGYAIALFSAGTGLTIKEILSAIPVEEWKRLYSLCHEYGDELLFEKLADVYDARVS